ncbi:glucosamine-6-phosphate deaminase [Ructibacterium gallinarum]|uniref:Glucosamine-6-phosphate deaminase n=1 Tax=Ructibacterium gallinarum TaxID=2779355 RepID=A0A9D5M2Y0_9FIRM|nr:glucosamine-6-phosphate deaminase [Ructibacterium gallinarum]MBE5039689.1 glucosamine-6-phosphate deaminase [Ructibacterium gallinarum]
MRLIICENYNEISKKSAEIVAAQILLKPNCTLGLATGSSPVGMYENLTAMNLDFSEVTTFNLDEYYPINKKNDQSYYYFMNQHLYSKVNLSPEKIHIPNGSAADPQEECLAYDKAIEENGGIDLQVLGIGQNGHIGFNEPAETLLAGTHITKLTQNTIEANSRFFKKIEDVPTQALTMGIAPIMKAKTILLIANGKSKAPAIKALMHGIIDPKIPATLLSCHPNTIVIVDKEAASLL